MDGDNRMEIKWYRLEDLAAKKFYNIPNNTGIYFIRWSRNGKPVPISRLRGLDDKGILYIGSAKKLRRRVQELWKGINGKVEAHTIGKTIIFCKIFEVIDLNKYEISWEELETHGNAVGQEWVAIKSYAEKFKEPPPLNLGIRREFFAIWGIAKFDKSRFAYETDEFVRSIINS
jgi:predicted GIY-YIG superfamily endonuclease